MTMRSPNAGDHVELFELDFTRQGGGIMYLVNGAHPVSIDWQGIPYTSTPIIVDGVQNSYKGSAPTASVMISNIEGIMNAQIALTGDLIGGRITRSQVDRESLDDGLNPSASTIVPIDVFVVGQSGWGSTEVSLQCSTQLGNSEVEIPTHRMTIDRYGGLGRVF